MFNLTAEWYDALYQFKDNAGECDQLRSLIETQHPRARRILDVGCGGGMHARCLGEYYRVDGNRHQS